MNERAVLRKSRVGRVVSHVMDKTVVVLVERRVHHPIYHKSVRHVKKFKAHDERNEYKVGDVVRLTETRPLSRTKRWRVAELLHREEVVQAQQVDAVAEVEESLEEAAVDEVTVVAEVGESAEQPTEASAEDAGEATAEAEVEESAEEPAEASAEDADEATVESEVDEPEEAAGPGEETVAVEAEEPADAEEADAGEGANADGTSEEKTS